MTSDEIRERISLLANEIRDNEEENRFMRDEIDKLYDILDEIEGNSK